MNMNMMSMWLNKNASNSEDRVDALWGMLYRLKLVSLRDYDIVSDITQDIRNVIENYELTMKCPENK